MKEKKDLEKWCHECWVKCDLLPTFKPLRGRTRTRISFLQSQEALGKRKMKLPPGRLLGPKSMVTNSEAVER